MRAGGGKDHEQGYTHSLKVQEAESPGTRAKRKGPGGVTQVSASEEAGNWGARKMLKMLPALEQGGYATLSWASGR